MITRNQMLTMLASGLWHGAAWTFVSWGFVHGLLLVAQRQIGTRVRALYPQTGLVARASIIAQIITVFVAVAATRILFRSPDLERAGHVFEKILKGPYNWGSLDAKPKLAICVLLILSVTICEIATENGIWRRLVRTRRWLRFVAVLIIFLVTLVLGDFEGGRFVYVRF
jgi:D-alanyl-lipoteichoic acid acyltransferase DltB (MBOAT superfamily)